MQNLRITVNRIALQVREYEREGEAILFLHFGGGNLMMWQPAIPFFQDRYRLILVDLRGHGRSDAPETGYHIDDIARDVSGVMAHLKLERAHIIGSSLGAEVGLSLAANYPQKVLSLACDGALSSEFGPYSTWEGTEAEFQAHVAEQMEAMRSAPLRTYPSVDAMVEAIRQMLEKQGLWSAAFEAQIRYDARRLEDGSYTKSWGRAARLGYMEAYFACRFEDYYRRVKCPLLMLPNAEEAQDSRAVEVMKKLQLLADHAQIASVPGWVHPYGWLLHPEEMCRTILVFLKKVSMKEHDN